MHTSEGGCPLENSRNNRIQGQLSDLGDPRLARFVHGMHASTRSRCNRWSETYLEGSPKARSLACGVHCAGPARVGADPFRSHCRTSASSRGRMPGQPRCELRLIRGRTNRSIRVASPFLSRLLPIDPTSIRRWHEHVHVPMRPFATPRDAIHACSFSASWAAFFFPSRTLSTPPALFSFRLRFVERPSASLPPSTVSFVRLSRSWRRTSRTQAPACRVLSCAVEQHAHRWTRSWVRFLSSRFRSGRRPGSPDRWKGNPSRSKGKAKPEEPEADRTRVPLSPTPIRPGKTDPRRHVIPACSPAKRPGGSFSPGFSTVQEDLGERRLGRTRATYGTIRVSRGDMDTKCAMWRLRHHTDVEASTTEAKVELARPRLRRKRVVSCATGGTDRNGTTRESNET